MCGSILGALRAQHPALRGRDSFYYDQSSQVSAGIIGYRRAAGNDFALVSLNFSDTPQAMTVPSTGAFREQIDAADRPAPLDLKGATGDPMTVTVPANYGDVFTTS